MILKGVFACINDTFRLTAFVNENAIYFLSMSISFPTFTKK